MGLTLSWAARSRTVKLPASSMTGAGGGATGAEGAAEPVAGRATGPSLAPVVGRATAPGRFPGRVGAAEPTGLAAGRDGTGDLAGAPVTLPGAAAGLAGAAAGLPVVGTGGCVPLAGPGRGAVSVCCTGDTVLAGTVGLFACDELALERGLLGASRLGLLLFSTIAQLLSDPTSIQHPGR